MTSFTMIPNKPEGFSRITVDNKLFKDIQIKNIEDYITEDCIVVIDSDTVAFTAASLQDKTTVQVRNLKTQEVHTFKSNDEFKGRSPTKIKQGSWLGGENLKREAEGKELYAIEDFESTPHRELKGREETCMEHISEYIDAYISGILKQSGCSKVLCIIGEGDCHRNKLLLPEEYKSNRDPNSRPLLLKQSRAYLEGKYDTIVAKGIEADDICEMYATEGYNHYLKTGKFNYMLSAVDKDARGTPSLLLDYGKQGPIWKNPNPWLIENTAKGVGCIEFVGGEGKCTGIMQVCYQLLTGDSTDHFHPYLKFPKDMHQPRSNAYADGSFYKDFVTLKTSKDCLQKVVDKYFEFFPKGLQFTAWEGTEVDEDTLWWLEQIFVCVYMLRKDNDKTNLKQLLDHFKVDYTKIVGNNVEKVLPFKPEEELREEVGKLKVSLEGLIKKNYKSTDKKGILLECLDNKSEMLDNVLQEIDNFFLQ